MVEMSQAAHVLLDLLKLEKQVREGTPVSLRVVYIDLLVHVNTTGGNRRCSPVTSR